MLNKEFAGVWTAMVTPFDDVNEVDYDAFSSLLDRQIAAGVKGVVLCGTTGEAPTLTVTEKLSLVKRASVKCKGKLSLMVGCGGNDTAQTIDFAGLCVDAGAESLMVVTPPYNKPPLAGLKQHYQKIAESVKVPLVVYHVPGRTGQKLSPNDMTELVHCHDQIVAVKEASGNPIEFSRYMVHSGLKARKPVSWLSGDDHGFLPTLAVGGAGVVSVASNVFPEALVDIYNSFLIGDHPKASLLHKALFNFMDDLFCEVNPVPVNAALKYLKLTTGKLRLPLCEGSEQTHEKMALSCEIAGKALEIIYDG